MLVSEATLAGTTELATREVGRFLLRGKTAAILGPLVFGLASRLTGGNQRIAIVSVGLFFVIGLVLVRGVDAGGPIRERTHAHNEPARR